MFSLNIKQPWGEAQERHTEIIQTQSPNTHLWLLQTWDKATFHSLPITSTTFTPAHTWTNTRCTSQRRSTDQQSTHTDAQWHLWHCASACHNSYNVSVHVCVLTWRHGICVLLIYDLSIVVRFCRARGQWGGEKKEPRNVSVGDTQKTDTRERVDKKLTDKSPLWFNKLNRPDSIQITIWRLSATTRTKRLIINIKMSYPDITWILRKYCNTWL